MKALETMAKEGEAKAPAETTVLPPIRHRTGAAPLSAESNVRSSQALHPEQDSEEEEGCRMPAAAILAPAGAAGSGRLTPAQEWKNATEWSVVKGVISIRSFRCSGVP